MKKNIVFYVTRQYMKQNKGRTFTTFAGIVFMVLLMTCVFVGRDTGIYYLQDVASLKNGKWHVSMYGITSEKYEEVREMPNVKETALSAALGSTLFGASANPERPYLNLKAYSVPCFDWMNIKLSEGRLPENSREIIVSKSAAEDGSDIAVGDLVEAELFERSITGINSEIKETVFPFQNITIKYGETKDVPEEFPYWGENEDFRENRTYTGQKGTYQVVGIMEPPAYEQMGAAGYTAITLLEDSQAAALETFNLSLILDLENNPDQDILGLLRAAGAGGYEIDVNDYVLAFTASTSDTTLNLVVKFMTVFFVVLIMAASVILIYNVFNMSFQERSRYLGMLCSIGATGRQKRSSIFYEAFFLLVFALPTGVLLGIGVIRLAMAAFRPFIGSFLRISSLVTIDPAVIRISWENLAAVILASTVTVLISAWLPARKIGKIGPVECIRGNIWKKSRQYQMQASFIHMFGAEGMLAKNMLLRRNKKVRSVGSAAAVFMVVLTVTIFGSDAVHRIIRMKMGEEEMSINTERYDYVLYAGGSKFEALKEEIEKDAGVEYTAKWRDGMFAGQVPVEAYGAEYWDALHGVFNLYYHRELSEEEFREEHGFRGGTSMPVNILSVDMDTMRDMAGKIGADADRLLDPEQTSAIVLSTGAVSTSSFMIDGMSPEKYRMFRISKMTDMKEGDTVPVSLYSPDEEKEVEMSVEIAGFAETNQLQDYVEFKNNNYMWLIVNEAAGSRMADILRVEGADSSMMDEMLLIRMNGKPTDIIDRLQRASEQDDARFGILETEYQSTMANAISGIVDVMLFSFIVLTSVICLLNLFNSIRGWRLESRQEIAVLRSVGMASGQMKKMLLYECTGIFLWALLLAGVFSGMLIACVRFGLVMIFGNLELPTPWLWIAGAALVVGAVLTGLTLYGFGRERQEELYENMRREGV